MGHSLSTSSRFGNIDCILPLPLFSEKQKRRGYNQAAVIAEGISEILDRPLITGAVMRNRKTDTQTHKNRIERWQNVESVFSVKQSDRIRDQHVLLVDDVITTGATIEACGESICRVPGTTLSVATLAWTLPY